MKEYKLYDKVWTYSIALIDVNIKCPVCDGSGYCIVFPWTAGDLDKIFQDHFKIKCEYCDGSKVKSGDVYNYKLNLHQFVIDGYDVRGGKIIEYKCNSIKNSYHTLDLKRSFDTEAEAKTAGEIELQETLNQKKIKELQSNGYHIGKMTYHRGYHITEIESLRSKVEYHRKQLGMSSEEFDKWIEDIKPYYKKETKRIK